MIPAPVTYGPIEPLGLRGWCYQFVSPSPSEQWLRAVRDDGLTVTHSAPARDEAIAELRRVLLAQFPDTTVVAVF